MNKKISLFLVNMLVFVVFVFSVNGENWDVTITATNQLESVTFGLHESATDAYDDVYDAFTQNPIQGKVIMSLDDIYATNIKTLNYPKYWDLGIGIPVGQTTTLSWDISSLPDSINLTLYDTLFTLDINAQPSLELGEGSHTFTILASEQCVPSTEVCDGGDNDCDGLIDEDLTQPCGSGNCQGTQTCNVGVWSDCSSSGNDAGICAMCDENGNEVYDETQDSDCNQYDLPEIAICTNDPDNNPFTWDYAASFDSVCSGLKQCTQGSYSYTHDCDILSCGAECEDNDDCDDNNQTTFDYCNSCACIYEDCIPNWVLNDTWSKCVNGSQYKNYHDMNNCSTDSGKPDNVYQDCDSFPPVVTFNIDNGSTISNNLLDLIATTNEMAYCWQSDYYEYPTDDLEPPTISNPSSFGEINTMSCIQLKFYTNERAYCKGEINEDKDFDDMSISFGRNQHALFNYSFTHSISLYGPNTVYIKCKDLSGNIASFNWNFENVASPGHGGCGDGGGGGLVSGPLSLEHTWEYSNLHDYYTYLFEITCRDTYNNTASENLQIYTDFCIPNWIEVNTSCLLNDAKVGYYLDSNSCYETTGSPSDLLDRPENISYSCDYCTPNWQCSSYDSCQENDRQQCNGTIDLNSCYNSTDLLSDQYSGDYSEFLGFCDYDNNGIIGKQNETTTNLEDLSISIGNSTDLTQNCTSRKLKVEFKEGNGTVIKFDFNFTAPLNLANITIEKQATNATNGGIIISGIDLTAQGETKTVYVDRLAAEDYVCIKDEEIASITELPLIDCSSGTPVPCPGSSGAYTCSLANNNTQFKVEGLSHSGITESTYSPPSTGGPGGGGGGGGGGAVERVCVEAWTCTDWGPTPCPVTRQQTRTCTDRNNCGTTANKPNEIRTCFYYVATEEVEEVAEKIEEAPLAVAPPEEAPATPPAGMFAITGAAIGTAYQERPATMWILTVFILLIIVLFIYAHVRGHVHWPFHFKHPKKWLVILVIIILIMFILLFIHFVLLTYARVI